MSQASQSKMKQPNAMLELGVNNDDTTVSICHMRVCVSQVGQPDIGVFDRKLEGYRSTFFKIILIDIGENTAIML